MCQWHMQWCWHIVPRNMQTTPDQSADKRSPNDQIQNQGLPEKTVTSDQAIEENKYSDFSQKTASMGIFQHQRRSSVMTSESGDALGKRIGAVVEDEIHKHKSIGTSEI